MISRLIFYRAKDFDGWVIFYCIIISINSSLNCFSEYSLVKTILFILLEEIVVLQCKPILIIFCKPLYSVSSQVQNFICYLDTNIISVCIIFYLLRCFHMSKNIMVKNVGLKTVIPLECHW